MTGRRPSLLLLLLLPLGLLTAPAVRAEEGSGSDAEEAIHLQGNLGLTGFMDMVDARTPGLFSVRLGSRYQVFVRDRDFKGTGVTRSDRRHEIVSALGVSFLGMVDVSARMPYLWTNGNTDSRSGPDPDSDSDRGWGDLDLAGKVSLELGPFVVAPFLHGKVPVGEPAVSDLAELDYGGAATFSLLNGYVSLHANLAGAHRETGLESFRYRVGVAFVPFATDDYLVRVYCYGDGIEFEGRSDSDIDLDVGIQAIVFANLWVELGGSVRLLDAGEVDETLDRELRGLDGASVGRHFRDEGTWSFQVGVGTYF